MQLCRPVELGEIRHHELGFVELGAHWLEIDDLRHLDLRVQSAALIRAKARHVADRECVRAHDLDLAWCAIIQLLHPLHLSKADEVAILKTMPCLL